MLWLKWFLSWTGVLGLNWNVWGSSAPVGGGAGFKKFQGFAVAGLRCFRVSRLRRFRGFRASPFQGRCTELVEVFQGCDVPMVSRLRRFRVELR